jgi:hypothetical protein
MPMDTSLAPFKQLLRKLCLFRPPQSWEPLLGHCCPGCCHGTTPHSNCHISFITPPIKMFMSIIELAHHKIYIAHGLTLVTPSFYGWKAFPTPGALTRTRITWARSPPATQVPGVTPRSPLCPWCFGHSS